MYATEQINAEVTDPVMFMTNFTCSDEHHIRHWAEPFVIIIQIIGKELCMYSRVSVFMIALLLVIIICSVYTLLHKPAEVHITHMWLDQNQLYIACNSNYMYTDQVYDLYGPNGIIDIECSSDGCQVTLSHPNSGQYHCELELDGELIKSETVTINITIDIDTPSTQLLITTPPQSVNTTIISLGSVGGLALVAFIVATILLCAVIILYYRRGRNRYQQLPNGKITDKLCIEHHICTVLFYCLALEGFPL